MTTFERRLQNLQRRPAKEGDPCEVTSCENPTTIGWLAAEKLTRLTDVAPGTVITLTVSGGEADSTLEIQWGADGVPIMRQVPAVRA